MKKLYKFFKDYGRQGYLSGIFVEDSERVAEHIGVTIVFGEVLGKHSCVTVRLEPSHFQVMTDNQEFIQVFEDLKLEQGYNPFDYLEIL
jgi:hypothetical protein